MSPPEGDALPLGESPACLTQNRVTFWLA